MAAVRAVLLSSNPAHGLGRWTRLVDHSVCGLVTAYLGADYHHFFLRYPDRLVALGTQVATHLSRPRPLAIQTIFSLSADQSELTEKIETVLSPISAHILGSCLG